MIKKITNAEVLNIIGYADTDTAIINKKDTKLTMEFVWKFRKNIKRLRSLKEEYDSMIKDLAESYSNDEKSHVVEDGSRILNQEYTDEYNQKVYDLLIQENEVNVDMIDFDRVIIGGISAMNEIGISLPELNVIMFMIDDDEQEE